MQLKMTPITIIIFIGCSTSIAWPLENNKPLPKENDKENTTEPLTGRHRDIESTSFFLADEKWLKIDERRQRHLIKRNVPVQSERGPRKRPYVPLNSLTFMTANNEVAPIDWYSSNATDIRQHIAGSKLAGHRKPNDQITSTSRPFGNSTLIDENLNKFSLFYTTTKKSLPLHEFFTEPSKYNSAHITETPTSTIHSSTSRQPSIATLSPPKSNSFLSGSKLITFIPVLRSTTPPPYRITEATSSSNASSLQNAGKPPHQNQPSAYPSRAPLSEYTTKRSVILNLMDKVIADSSAQDIIKTTEVHTTTVDTNTKLSPHTPADENVTWPSSKKPNITDGYFTAQYFLEANFPNQNLSDFRDKNTTDLEIIYKKPTVSQPVNRPNLSNININSGNSNLTSSANSTTAPTSAPLTITDQLVLHEAFNKLKNQQNFLSSLINTDTTLPTVNTQPVTFIEEPSAVGLSDIASIHADSEKTDDGWSTEHTRITETAPTTDWVTAETSTTPEPPNISTFISSGTSSPYYIQITPLTTKISASPTYYSQSFSQHINSGTNETIPAELQPLAQNADEEEQDKPGINTTTVPSQPSGDSTVSDYEYNFFEDDLNSGENSSHPIPDNSSMNLSSSNTEHYFDVMVRVWEMVGGQLNLVKEQPVPIEMFQNTSLANGAVVNPQDVPTKVMAMVSSTIQANHPLLNPENYRHTRRRRSPQNFTENTPIDTLNLKPFSNTRRHTEDNIASHTNSSVKSLPKYEQLIVNAKPEAVSDYQESKSQDSLSTTNLTVPLFHTIMQKLMEQISASSYILKHIKQTPDNVQFQNSKNNLFTVAPSEGRNMYGNAPSVQNFNGGTFFSTRPQNTSATTTREPSLSPYAAIPTRQSENSFGGVGNHDHSNLPLAIGTALQESDTNYLQTLYKFANLLAHSSETQPTVESYLKTILQSPQATHTPSRFPLTNYDLNSKSDVKDLRAAQRTDETQNQQNLHTNYGSILEFLPPELPHINPLVTSNEASGQNPVDLGKVITSLPSSSTLTREKLKNKLATVTGTNTFSGHLGNQGYVSHNSHGAQNSISGNYNDHAYSSPDSEQPKSSGTSSFLTRRQSQQPVPTSINEPYYPFSYEMESNPTSDHEFPLVNLLPDATFQGQQNPNIQHATLSNSHDVLSQTLFQNVGQQQSLPNTEFVNQIQQQRPSAMAELGIQQPFISNLNTETHNTFFDAQVPNTASLSSNNLLGISNYPTPLLDFIFQNMSSNKFQPQQNNFPFSPIQASEPIGPFNPNDPYIPALDVSILGETSIISPINLLPQSSTPIKPVAATFTSGSGSSVANCQGNAACILGLAGLASLGISKALLLPFFLGRRRRRRQSPDLMPHTKSSGKQAELHHLFPNFIKPDNFTDDNMKDITAMNDQWNNNELRDNDHSNNIMPKRKEPIEQLFHQLPKHLQLNLMLYTLEVLSQKQMTSHKPKEKKAL